VEGNLSQTGAADSPSGLPEPAQILVDIDENEAKAFVTVSSQGQWPSFTVVVDALKAAGVVYRIDEQAIRKLLEARLADQRLPVARAQDGKVTITLDKGDREAYMLVEPAFGGREVEEQDIERALREKSVTFGIDREAIDQALQARKLNSNILIAVGKEPVDGNDAVIQYLFRTESAIHPKETEAHQIDYKELESVVSVQKGAVLARKIPPTAGEHGSTVTGKQISAKPGKDVRLKAGKNTSLSPDQLELISGIDGQPILRDKSVNIEPVLNVDNDIDYCTGNINFAGSVRVAGNVISGFTLKASEHIHIEGLVEDCHIEAGGDVLIKGGIQGRQKGVVKAGGNVSALFMEQATVEAGGCITTSETLHSSLLAGEEVVITSGKGRICGGTVSARNLIHARIIGAESGVLTTVAVGFAPKEKAHLEALKKEKVQREATLEEVGKGIATLNQYKVDSPQLWARYETAYDRLIEARLALQTKIEELTEEITTLEETLAKTDTAQVKVNKIMHPNVHIRIKDLLYNNESEVSASIFREIAGEIQPGPYT
jgi:uncharacterized protein (DUF342 family)